MLPQAIRDRVSTSGLRLTTFEAGKNMRSKLQVAGLKAFRPMLTTQTFRKEQERGCIDTSVYNSLLIILNRQGVCQISVSTNKPFNVRCAISSCEVGTKAIPVNNSGSQLHQSTRHTDLRLCWSVTLNESEVLGGGTILQQQYIACTVSELFIAKNMFSCSLGCIELIPHVLGNGIPDIIQALVYDNISLHVCGE